MPALLVTAHLPPLASATPALPVTRPPLLASATPGLPLTPAPATSPRPFHVCPMGHGSASPFLLASGAGDSATVTVANPYLAYTHGLCTWPIHMAYTHAYSYAYTHGLYTWLP